MSKAFMDVILETVVTGGYLLPVTDVDM